MTENRDAGTTWLHSLNVKLTLLVLIPSITLGAIGIGVTTYLSDMSTGALNEVNQAQQESRAFNAATGAVHEQVVAFRASLSNFVSHHQGGLLRNQLIAAVDELKALERQASILAEAAVSELAPVKESLSESLSSEPKLTDNLTLLEKRYNFVIRNARNLPRLLKIFDESHQRTVALLAEGLFDRARINYVFEESARAQALQRTAEHLTAVLDELAEDAAVQITSNLEHGIASAQHSIDQASTTTLWGISIAVGVFTLMAVMIARIMVSRPIGKLTDTMRRLAEGQLDTEIVGDARRDEIGAMARMLGIFKTNAETARRLQAERDAKVAIEAEEAEQRRQQNEALGQDIVTLVERVINGDLSQRLSIDGRTGILADVCRQINQLVDGLQTVFRDVSGKIKGLASGDLNQRVTADYQGAFGELKDGVNQTMAQFAGIVTEIQTAASEVNNAAAEIAGGTSDLSTRTEQAASNIQETAASTEEMAATVRQNAESAKNASQLAEAANQAACKGGEVVEQAVSAMSGIEGSAQKITDIISVIDEIAFQTNLLALNASVEAARAGEAGKGFAVVAQEVRQLAQRSAQAASDIKVLIQDSNGQVNDGVQLVNQAGKALDEIVGSIGKVAGIVREISSASLEQASGVQEINSAVNTMDEMTQQNSALVEESTAAASALSDQASKLTELMVFFKLDSAVMPACRPSRSLQQPTRSKPARSGPEANQSAMAAASDEVWDEF